MVFALGYEVWGLGFGALGLGCEVSGLRATRVASRSQAESPPDQAIPYQATPAQTRLCSTS